MKKCLFFLSFLLLTSCAAQDGEQAARAIAARWKDAGAVTVTASITAEFSDRAADYRVQFAGNHSAGINRRDLRAGRRRRNDAFF